ncbi:MAG: helix-turn-helix domain-containing protein [Pseudonocardiales bacterium]
MTPYSPTLRGRRLGLALRRLRAGAGLSSSHVASQVGWSASKISRIEGGYMTVSPGDVRELLAVYNVTGPEAEALVALAREARQRGWWHPHNEIVPGWLQAYLSMETDASRICVFELGAVPDLLQTADYTAAVIDAQPQPSTPDEQDVLVGLWHTRQNRLTADPAMQLDVIITEGALRQHVGGPAVMRAQLEHLAEAAAWPNVVIRVLPFRAGAHPAMNSGAFSVLEFSEPDDPRTVYAAQLTGGIYLEVLREVGTYRLAYEQLRVASLGPEDSAEFIGRLAGELTAP